MQHSQRKYPWFNNSKRLSLMYFSFPMNRGYASDLLIQEIWNRKPGLFKLWSNNKKLKGKIKNVISKYF